MCCISVDKYRVVVWWCSSSFCCFEKHEVPLAMWLNIEDLWDVILCRMVNSQRSSEGS